MKASLRWLREFVDLPEDAEEVRRALDLLGAQVEGMETLDAPFTGVVVADVVGVEAHPDADRLRVVTVDVAGDERVVVCGAWNFDAGALVAYAPPGATLAGGLEVGERAIRGVSSPGMICSEAELGLGDDAEGILVLGPDEARSGADLASVALFPDVVFELEITPNRPDLMSMHGLARDLGALLDVPVRPPEESPVRGSGSSRVTVRIDAPDRCRRFTAREISGVTVGTSPLWMRARLRAVGVRPVANVVDVTNYVMMEMGQPLHAFDLERVADEAVVVRTADDGETMTTLDGEERTLRATDLVIADATRPMGLAGIMGGADTEVTESTSRVLLEVASFEPGGVLLSGKRHGLRSEASARFERGVDPELPPRASARATRMLVDICGGEAVGPLIDEQPEPFFAPVLTLRPSEVERLLGVILAPDVIGAMLERLGFEVETGDVLTVTVPSYRPDVARPVDLVEEVARLHGLDAIPSRVRKGAGGGLPAGERIRRRVRQVMLGAGYFEVLSFDFVSAAEIALFGFSDARGRPLRLRNPLSEEQAHLRTTLIPGLLSGLRVNSQRNRADVALFEIGAVFLESDGPIPAQPHLVSFASMGRRPGASWEEPETRDAFDGTGMIDALFREFGVGYELAPAPASGLHPGRSAVVTVGAGPVGFVGEVHPHLAAAWDLAGRVVVGEVDTAALDVGAARVFRPTSPYPPVVFDLAFDLPSEAPARSLVRSVEESAGERLEAVSVFDVFTGPPLDDGRKSIALRLTFRDPERTLTDEDLAPVRAAIASHVAEAVGGRLRGA